MACVAVVVVVSMLGSSVVASVRISRLDSDVSGLSVELPRTWTLQQQSPGGIVLHRGTPYEGDYCGSRDARSVTLSVGELARGAVALPTRSAALESARRSFWSGVPGDEHECGERAQSFEFEQDERRVGVWLIAAGDTPPSRVRQAYAIIGSLRLLPSTWEQFCAAARDVARTQASLGATTDEVAVSFDAMRRSAPQDPTLVAALNEVEPHVLEGLSYDGWGFARTALGNLSATLSERCELTSNAFSQLLSVGAPGR